MAEFSGLWTTSGTPAGHQVTSYTQAHWSTILEVVGACFGVDGVAPSYLNALAGTGLGSNQVQINTGGALVDGKAYKNDAAATLSHGATPSTRCDRIVVRTNWATFETKLTIIKGTDGSSTPPSLTQTKGTTYDLPLYQVLLDSGGSTTLTDERAYARAQTAGIADSAVTAAKIASNAVQTTQIQDGAVTSAKIANRTRKFIVTPTGTGSPDLNALGIPLTQTGTTEVRGSFFVPSDYVSGLTVISLGYALASGTINYSASIVTFAVGEGSSSSNYPNFSKTFNVTELTEIQSLTPSVALGDAVGLSFQRNGDHAGDALAGDVLFVGWLVEYTADS